MSKMTRIHAHVLGTHARTRTDLVERHGRAANVFRRAQLQQITQGSQRPVVQGRRPLVERHRVLVAHRL